MFDFIFKAEADFIAGALEPFAKFVQKISGITCFGLAKICMITSMATCIIGAVLLTLVSCLDTKNAVMCAFNIIILAFIFAQGCNFITRLHPLSLKAREGITEMAMAQGYKNPYLHYPRMSCCFLIPCLISFPENTGLFGFTHAYQIGLFWLAVAFSSCTPSTPFKSSNHDDLGKNDDEDEDDPTLSATPSTESESTAY